MADLKAERQLTGFKCGQCGAENRYLVTEEAPELCRECGYSHKLHGTRKVNDIPSTIKVYLNDVNNE